MRKLVAVTTLLVGLGLMFSSPAKAQLAVAGTQVDVSIDVISNLTVGSVQSLDFGTVTPGNGSAHTYSPSQASPGLGAQLGLIPVSGEADAAVSVSYDQTSSTMTGGASGTVDFTPQLYRDDNSSLNDGGSFTLGGGSHDVQVGGTVSGIDGTTSGSFSTTVTVDLEYTGV